MAGLLGVISFRDTFDAVEVTKLIEKMAGAQRHRAPGGGRVASNRRFAYFASDASATAKSSQQDAHLLAFDGAITNRSEIGEKLRKLGTELVSNSDRELVMCAWEHWKEQCAEHLDGRFAFVLYDPTSGESLLVRDRFGHLPIHYGLSNGQLFFASEIKALLPVTPGPELNELALLEWSLYGDLLPPRTLFRGIQSVPPGHIVRIASDGRILETRAYYNPADVIEPERYAAYAARPIAELLTIVDDAIEHAVLGHISARDDVGIMLSGGVDSTVIAAMAVKHRVIRGYNFSVAGDPRLDERPMAKEVARKLGISLETMVVDGAMYRRNLAHATYSYEMPLWHMQGVPIHLLAHRAHEDGISMLLSGVSVGPLLGAATDRYRWILPPPFLGRIPNDLFRIARKAVYTASGLQIANPFFSKNLGIGLQLVDGGARSRVVARCDESYRFLQDLKERRLHVMRLSDNALFLPRFFQQGDQLCMGASVEYCDAAVEAGFMAMALNMPTNAIFHKNKTPKWILKEVATRYVPRDIAFQKKIPLDVPIDEYFTAPFQSRLFNNGFLDSFLGLNWDTANALVGQARERRPLLFQLVNIETWGRLFMMQQDIEEVQDLLSA